jgi:hypothetical protein
MAKQKQIENVLASWVVDAATWRDFVRAVRSYQQQPRARHCSLEIEGEVPPSGIKVVIGDHTAAVGSQSFSLRFLDNPTVTLRESWLEFDSGEAYFFPVPVPNDAQADAARVADHFTQQTAEQFRLYAEARARPTLSNHLLNFVEGHFALAMFILFFILIPAFVVFLLQLERWIPGFRLMRDD